MAANLAFIVGVVVGVAISFFTLRIARDVLTSPEVKPSPVVKHVASIAAPNKVEDIERHKPMSGQQLRQAFAKGYKKEISTEVDDGIA